MVRVVQEFQIRSFLTVRLTANTPYRLRFSAPDAAAPRYGPAEFRQRINSSPAFVRVVNMRPTDSPVGKTSTFGLPRWLVWVALDLVLALLAFRSVRMLREVGNAKG